MAKVNLDLNKLRFLLQNRIKANVIAENAMPAAVLLPLFKKEDMDFILFTLRTHEVEHHKGQISFPGGAFHPQDKDLLTTALREADEEIGLKPQEVTILGELDPVITRSNFSITPFVGCISSPRPWERNAEEVAEIIEVPLQHLLDKRNYWQENDQGRIVHFFDYRGKIIWGATALILKQFLEIARFAFKG